MKEHKTTLAGTNYITSELMAELRSMKDRFPIGHIFTRRHKDMLLELLKRHPNYRGKARNGIKEIVVGGHSGCRGFAIITNYGRTESFSYKKCLTGEEDKANKRVMKAFRCAVKSQTQGERQKVKLPTTCAISGKPIRGERDFQVDHIYPFSSLVNDFLRDFGHNIEKIKTKKVGNYYYFESRKILAQWQQYHFDLAKYQIVRNEENLMKGSKVPVRR